jgi:hypothetical protein
MVELNDDEHWTTPWLILFERLFEQREKNMLNQKIRSIPVPPRLRGFPLSDEGYPVPWFVPFIDGKPEFRGMDGAKFKHAVSARRCWLCGGLLGRYLTFPIGPMCAITRTTAEPPSHLDCAEYAVRVCPFLTQPRMRRNEKDLPESGKVAGISIPRNPGVTVLWTCLDYQIFDSNGTLFRVGEPQHVECWANGQRATKQEILDSIESGYPLLQREADRDGADAIKDLAKYRARAYRVLGLEDAI